MEWFCLLSEEDQEFIHKFIISSGSIKKLSQIYGVSYPTIRARLDKIIEFINFINENENQSFEIKIMQMVVEEKISFDIAKEIIKKYKE